MPCYVNTLRTCFAWVALVAFIALGLLGQPAFAASKIESTAIRLTPSVSSVNNPGDVRVGGWDLQADFNIELSPRLIDLAKTTPLYFVLEWRMTRGRWYWRDERLAQGQLYWRLSHNLLTQQWRLSSANTTAISDGRLAQTYATLDEALNALRRIRRDRFVLSSALEPNQRYDLSLRLKLDSTQLPKPFQLNALTNNDWELDSGAIDYSFVAAAPISAMTPIAPK